MLKSFGIGVLLLGIASLVSLFMQDLSILMKYAGIIGLVFIVMSGVYSGGLGSGDRIRANAAHESPDETRKRFRLFRNLFMIGFPNLFTCVVIYIMYFI